MGNSNSKSSRWVRLARFNGIVSRTATPKHRLRWTHTSMENKRRNRLERDGKGPAGGVGMLRNGFVDIDFSTSYSARTDEVVGVLYEWRWKTDGSTPLL